MTVLKTIRLKQQTAIEVLDSCYNYEDIKFFVEMIPDLILRNNYSALNQKDHANLGWLIKTMARLIGSAEMTSLLQKFNQAKCVKMKPETSLIKAI